MEGPPEGGNESPDSQGHATDWRFAVCSFRDAWDEEEPIPHMQVKDPNPPRPTAGTARGEGLQGSPLPREPQSPPGQMAVDGLGDGQGCTLGGSSLQLEEPTPSGVESLLCRMSSRLSLTQGESDSQGGGLARDHIPSGLMPPARLDPVDLGGSLSETSSELLEAGKGGRAKEVLEGVGAPKGGEPSDPIPAEAHVRGGGLWVGGPMQTQAIFLPKTPVVLASLSLLMISWPKTLPGSCWPVAWLPCQVVGKDWRRWEWGDLIGQVFTAFSQGLGM